MPSPDSSSSSLDSHPRFGMKTPSKVLHVRNMPLDVAEEDIRDFCAPFGVVVKCKLHVGPSKNQGFIEFQDIESAINMINHFDEKPDPPEMKGKPVYLQYSTRTEVINASLPPIKPSNVVLVTFDNWKAQTPPSIDFVHLLFSPFGDLMKVAIFEKAGNYQALVQFPELKNAQEALDVMNGHQLPRYMLPLNCVSCALRVEYSEHQDLVIKHQSDRFRDYTNPSLPPFDPQLLLANHALGSAASVTLPTTTSPSEFRNVLHCMIDNVRFPVTLEALYAYFSQCGTVEKIAIFEKNDNWQALVQYSDPFAAASAKAALDGQSMYGAGLHLLRITLSLHKDLFIKSNNERGWDFTVAPLPAVSYSRSLSSSGNFLFSNPNSMSSVATSPWSNESSCVSSASTQDYGASQDELIKLILGALQQTSLESPDSGLDFKPSTLLTARMPMSTRQFGAIGQPNFPGSIASLPFDPSHKLLMQNPLSIPSSSGYGFQSNCGLQSYSGLNVSSGPSTGLLPNMRMDIGDLLLKPPSVPSYSSSLAPSAALSGFPSWLCS